MSALPTPGATPPQAVHDEWSAVAAVLAPAAPASGAPPVPVAPRPVPSGHRPADLRLAMADGAARRDLRRILIAYGAIGKTRPEGSSGNPARPEDVVGAFMTAGPEVIDRLLRNAGAISDEARLVRFIAAIAEVGRQCDPSDAASVTRWIAGVGAVLRDDAGAV